MNKMILIPYDRWNKNSEALVSTTPAAPAKPTSTTPATASTNAMPPEIHLKLHNTIKSRQKRKITNRRSKEILKGNKEERELTDHMIKSGIHWNPESQEIQFDDRIIPESRVGELIHAAVSGRKSSRQKVKGWREFQNALKETAAPSKFVWKKF